MSKYKKRFEDYLTVKDYSNSYVSRITPFYTYLAKNNIAEETMTYDQYSNFVLGLKTIGLTNGSINNNMKAVRCFYNFLYDKGLCKKAMLNTINKIKLLPIDHKIKDFITEEELNKIISAGMTLYDRITPHKLKTIFKFLFYTGLRRDELLNLKREDINLEEKTVTVRVPNKTRLERNVFFPKEVKELLAKYFPTEKEKDNAFNLSERTLRDLVEAMRDYTKKNISIHTFRHSFANMLAKKGIDIRVAQKLLGHRSLQSTLIYYDPDAEICKSIYNEKIG